MSILDQQINAIKEIYSEIKKSGAKIQPVIVGKFALTVYTQGMYPANIISFLYPDLQLLTKVLKELGYQQMGDFWTRGDIVVEVSKKFKLIPTGSFNQIEVDGQIINVVSLEDLLVDMMNECVAGDETVCELIKMLIKSYLPVLDFHHIYSNLKNKQAVIKFKQYRKEAEG
ncbi:6-carboxyhexanoate--CoA ligase [Persephonella sp.]|uniref:6-carboxyhexanoate--CoA ligase n=1 Tax=Persephonella sp. TaxID=2060922 RepID=UPI0026197AB1|nr:6-carboxyhexanoate--CoA ligase [Persephonella sp.]